MQGPYVLSRWRPTIGLSLPGTDRPWRTTPMKTEELTPDQLDAIVGGQCCPCPNGKPGCCTCGTSSAAAENRQGKVCRPCPDGRPGCC